MMNRHRDISRRELASCTLLSLAILAASANSYAGDSSPYLFGDWDGARTHLADEGVSFNFNYTSEAAHNFSGGTQQLTRYTDQWNFGSTLDLGKLWGWKGSSFQIAITDRNGRNLGADADIGNYQLLQEVYGRGQTWHLSVFAFDQKLFDDRLELRIGRLPVGEDFDTFSCDFQNLTFCGAPAGNIVGDYWVNWPTSQWAMWIKLNTSDQSYVKLGAYQINPNYIDNHWAEANGWKPNFPGGTTGALIPLEFGWTPSIHGLPGSYTIGGWYNNAGGADLYTNVDREPLALDGGKPQHDSSRHGGYLTFQQQLTGDTDGHGLSIFTNAVMADSRTSATDRLFALGAEYKGIFNRPGDMIGLALGATHGSSNYAAYERLYNKVHPNSPLPIQDGYEYVTELFYNWAPLKALSLRPNLQYVLHPGGTTENKNAFVLGLKTVIVF